VFSVRDLFSLFHDLLRLSDLLLHHSDAHVRTVGGKLLSSSFRSFTSAYHRNMLIDRFTAEVSEAGMPATANAALAELHALVELDAREVRPYAAHIQTLAEFLLRFDDDQLRCVLDIYAMLSLGMDETSSAAAAGGRQGKLIVMPTCNILLQKQLGSAMYAMHRVGVLGTVALLKQIGGFGPATSEDAAPTRASNALQLFEAHWNGLLNDLERLPESSTRQADLFDEMSAAVECGCLHPTIVEFLKEPVCHIICRNNTQAGR
jgi:hypothetical protein